MDIWLEYDLLGNVSVVCQHCDYIEPFIYATFYYTPFVTDNASVKSAAFKQAKELGFQGSFEDIKITHKKLDD